MTALVTIAGERLQLLPQRALLWPARALLMVADAHFGKAARFRTLGVPVPSRHLQGQDSLLSIVQMPRGIPVATFAIGEAGAVNAGLFAVSLLANSDAALCAKLDAYRDALRRKVEAMTLPPPSSVKPASPRS